MSVLIKNRIFIISILVLIMISVFSGCSLKEDEKEAVFNSSLIETTVSTKADKTTKQHMPADVKENPDKKPVIKPSKENEINENTKIKAKGIYVTANSAGLESRFNSFIDMIDKTELNSMVIDVKNDHGVMTYPSEIEIVKEVMKGHVEPVRDIKELMSRLEEKNIYPIARIVVFRDPKLPKVYPEWAIKKKDGTVYKDSKGFTWLNPYEKKVWDYNIAIAKEAALMGFKEIQFDYIRFPEDSDNFDSQVIFQNKKDISKDDIISDFIKYAAEQLKDYNVHVSADVFGVIATYLTDKDGIGQTWEKITAELDYIYPMVYPSHYNAGFFGFSVPDAMPKETVTMALRDAIKRNATVKEHACIRPWLQGFTATWINGNIKYGPEQIREQVEAAMECGIEEFFIWNASNQYDIQSFITEEEALQKQQQSKDYRKQMGIDLIGNTAFTALEQYLERISKKDWRQAYPYHATGYRMDLKQFYEWADKWTFDSLDFNILSGNINNDLDSNCFYIADITIKKATETSVLEKEEFEVFIENNIWKIRPSVGFVGALTGFY